MSWRPKSEYIRIPISGSAAAYCIPVSYTHLIKLDKNIKHNIEIVVDRLVVKEGIERRLTDSIENVLALTEGLLVVDVLDGEPVTFSQSFSFPVSVSYTHLDVYKRQVYLLCGAVIQSEVYHGSAFLFSSE